MNDFLEENAVTNLSALRTEEQCWIGNILDSLAAETVIGNALGPEARLIDVGSGGGFPLLPLAIRFADLACTGLDSIAKKNAAVERIARKHNLKNVALITGRAETVAHDAFHRERYSIVTARALAPLPILLEYCAPFCKHDGIVIAWKSLHIDQELAASRAAQETLGCTLETQHRYTLPGNFGTRQLLLFRKIRPTLREYPRSVGQVKKKLL
jgi:16S rRNA (guanine527-N7)-methyltransferase